jgi:hypothetical protein
MVILVTLFILAIMWAAKRCIGYYSLFMGFYVYMNRQINHTGFDNHHYYSGVRFGMRPRRRRGGDAGVLYSTSRRDRRVNAGIARI